MVVKTRTVEIAGVAAKPDCEWMKQVARNLVDVVDGSIRNATYLILDRDPLFTEEFEAILRQSGVKLREDPGAQSELQPGRG